MESIWSVARLVSIWSSVRSTVGLPLQLLYAAAVGETLTGLLSMEASPSSTLTWEDVSIGGAKTSALWDRDMTASAAAAFSVEECSDSWLELSTMPCFSKASTSALRVILGFQGVLGVAIAGIGCAPPNGRVVHSGSSGEIGGMLIPMCGCSLVVMLELLCSSSGMVVTGWLPHSSQLDRRLVAQQIGAGRPQVG